jgi:LCP family protein required for cell wall assembly
MQSEKPTSRGRATLMVAGTAAVILLVAGLVLYPKLRQQWITPLGPGLDLPTQTATQPLFTATQPEAAQVASAPFATATNNQNSTPASSVAPTETEPADTPIPPTATQAPLCGGPPTMMILGVGVDTKDPNYRYGLGDAIRIARVDFVTPKVTVLTLPRDLWVNIPDIEDRNINQGKLNQSYFYGSPGMGYYDGPGAGPGLMARTLDLNFGLRVDHYGALNMQTFIDVVDAVGGIDLYLPEDVNGRPFDDHTADMGYFTAGQHHFTGDQALRFSRIRKWYSDFKRQDNQTMVLCALKEKLTNPKVITKIPKLVTAFQGKVLTDLSPEQIGQLACLLPQLKRENIIFTGLPQELLEPSRIFSPNLKKETFILDIDNEVVRDYVGQFVAGTWPTEPNEPSCP